MKIAIVSAVYYPMINGAATFTHNLATGLAKKGHDVIVICPSFTGKKHTEKKDGVSVRYLKSIRLPLYPDQINDVPEKKKIFGKGMPRLFYRRGIWVSPAPNREIKKILGRFRPDVIHCQTCDPIGLAVGHYARENDIPLVTTEHNFPDQFTAQITKSKLVKKPLDKALAAYLVAYQRKSDYVTMPTEIAIEDLILKRRRAFKVPIEALSNGVDLLHFRPGLAPKSLYDKYRVPQGRPIALYVGRVDPEKTVGRVVEAFSRALEKAPNAMLVIVGDGTDKARLQDLARYYGIEENVRFLGRILPPELYDVYKMGDFFVTASEIETQGIVLIEAAATGLPLIAVDRGAVREVCRTDENGFLCKAGGDIEGISEGMIKLFSDKELRDRMSEKSLEISKKHDINNTLKRFEEIYEEAIRIKFQKLKNKEM